MSVAQTGIVFFIATTALSIIAFLGGQYVVQKQRRHTVAWMAVFLSLLIAKTAFHFAPVWEATVFPWYWYIYFQDFWLYFIGLFFLGLGVGHFQTTRQKASLCVMVAIIFLASLIKNMWMVIPLTASSTQTADADHHCRQTTGFTCAPASCVSLLSYYGITATEGEMAFLCRTCSYGTSNFDAYYGLKLKLRGTPFKVKMINLDVRSFKKLKGPALCGRHEHAIVIQCENGQVLLHDPLLPRRLTIPMEQYKDTIPGEAVIIVPPGAQ